MFSRFKIPYWGFKREMQFWQDNWRGIFRPICWLRRRHEWANLGLFRQECEMCMKRREWKMYQGRGIWV